ncbi:phosphodiester glycosidase family protein [Alicyclobacillus tolerans]|uniref:phosphodiester glycosidase family protein n=1 Tax=Alicyclobacillus tolerans TaxID=90970 RepID=UPI001F38BC93|nr:phosphodiester glycosidase family protein [Alicyclobacillus tolerans]MCF8565118.1 phosphodiester glycosidase family protein [Alicyclobacillus tolerans]
MNPRTAALSFLATTLCMALLNPVSFAGSLSIPKKNIFYHNQLLSSPDGLVANDPSTGQETTFVPIAYVMYALKNSLGIQSGWDGTTWNFTLPSASSKLKVPQSVPPLANAQRRIAVNGNAIENVPSVVAVDPSSGKDTTYMPIWYVMQLLQNDLGIPSTWTGTNWYLGEKSSGSWQEYIAKGSMTVQDGQGTQTVTFVRVNPRAPGVSIEPVVAGNRFGSSTSLSSLAQSAQAVAAINGTFFNAGSNQQPQGALLIHGQFQHLWGPTLLMIGKDGSLSMQRVEESVQIQLGNAHAQGATDNQVWSAWGLNTWQGHSDEIDVLTPYYGASTNIPNGTSVVVENGVITGIHSGNTPIPKDGFVVELGSADASLASQVTIGQQAQFQVNVTTLTGNQPVDISNTQAAIGAGPMLVDGGSIVLNPSLEGLNAPSLLDPVTRRSFLGIDSSGDLVMATVRDANMEELAQIARNMHLEEAMNLDGGSSSGLYFDGQYLLSPERNLADALTVSFH